MQELTIRRPDDWHLHLRDGDSLRAVLPFTAQRFARAMVMPNLNPPVTTTAAALAYRQRILDALPAGAEFTPLMSLYLTDATTPEEIDRAAASRAISACKLYPAGATTHSESGVTDIRRLDATLEHMSERGLPLQVHGEVTAADVDVFDREARFIDDVLVPLRRRCPQLRVVFEHVTTRAAVEYVCSAPAGIGATITPQHLLLNRNALFQGGIRPHLFCLPVLKRESDRLALLAVIAKGDRRFFLGTDSAPHARNAKESACGCAGVFSAHAAIELYAEIFDQSGMLPRLEDFAASFGADFYGLPRNLGTLTLQRRDWAPPATYPFGSAELVPLRAAERVSWALRA
ncbi:MAG TPA: dihydroorotase [Steroidobacteraceae bacterium]